VADDDPELVALRALNERHAALCKVRFDGDGREDPAVARALEALEHEGAALIRAHCDRTLAPVTASLDAAIAEAHRLLGTPPPEPSPRAKALTEAFTEATREAARQARAYQSEPEIDLSGCAAIGVGGYHSDHYADPDDGVCQWCGATSRRDSTPPRAS
jgi:hypothetical protein